MVDFIVDPEGRARDCRIETSPSNKKPGGDWKVFGALTAVLLGLECWVYSDLLALDRGEVQSIVVWKPIADTYETFGLTGALLVLPLLWATVVFAWGGVWWLDRFGRGRVILQSIESCLAPLPRVLTFVLTFGAGGFLVFLVARDVIMGGNRIPLWLLIPAFLMLGLGALVITGAWRRR